MFVAIPHETVYLAKIVFIRSYCDFFINCRTTPIVRSFVRFANPQKRFCAGEQPNRCQSSPRCHASVSGRLRKLPGRKVTPEQIKTALSEARKRYAEEHAKDERGLSERAEQAKEASDAMEKGEERPLDHESR